VITPPYFFFREVMTRAGNHALLNMAQNSTMRYVIDSRSLSNQIKAFPDIRQIKSQFLQFIYSTIPEPVLPGQTAFRAALSIPLADFPRSSGRGLPLHQSSTHQGNRPTSASSSGVRAGVPSGCRLGRSDHGPHAPVDVR
jgi:hypothetical protein